MCSQATDYSETSQGKNAKQPTELTQGMQTKKCSESLNLRFRNSSEAQGIALKIYSRRLMCQMQNIGSVIQSQTDQRPHVLDLHSHKSGASPPKHTHKNSSENSNSRKQKTQTSDIQEDQNPLRLRLKPTKLSNIQGHIPTNRLQTSILGTYVHKNASYFTCQDKRPLTL